MLDKEILRGEAAHYRELAAQLIENFGQIDDETMKDTLEGLSDLPQMIEKIIRSSLEDEILITGLKARLAEMDVRLERFKHLHRRKRELATWAMGVSGLDRLKTPDFSVSLRQGVAHLEISDEAQIPQIYLIAQPPKIDRGALALALKQGEAVAGASMVMGEPHIQVRTK
jgi:hypothetical protein